MLIVAIVSLIVALFGGWMCFRHRERKEFILTTGCAIMLIWELISGIAALCSICSFIHWVFFTPLR